MKIAVMGAGGVGGYFGGRLAAAGADVTFIARGPHLEAIRDKGLTIESPLGGAHIHPARATDDPGEVDSADIVLFTPKLWDTEEAARAVAPALGRDGAVVSFQNGIDAADRLAAVLGRERVLGGVAEITAHIAAPGLIRHSATFARLIFGEFGGGRSARAEALLAACMEASVDAVLSEEIDRAIWQKFVFLVAFAGATAVTRRPVGDVRADPHARGLLVRLMEETAAVARAKGIALAGDFIEKRIAFIDSMPPGVTTSLAVDLDQGNRLELEWLHGAVVRLGEELGVPTPANGFVYAALSPSADGVG